FDERHNANTHRAPHPLGEEATEAYECARARLAAFIGAAEPAEVVFAKNISEGINLVAYAMGNASAAGQGGRFALGPGDEIVISEMEHHSNIVPWQLLCQRTGATLRWFGVTADGPLDTSGIDGLITERTKLVAVAHQSNVLGTINPIRALAEAAHAAGALLLVDAAQSVPHMPVDVAALGADFLGFTGHKMCGPTGIGVLWGRRELLEEMPPFLGGGEMIETVWMERSTFGPPPHKFEAVSVARAPGGGVALLEAGGGGGPGPAPPRHKCEAGTMPMAQVVGLAAAANYLSELGGDAIIEYEHGLVAHALEALAGIDGLRILGPAEPVDRG